MPFLGQNDYKRGIFLMIFFNLHIFQPVFSHFINFCMIRFYFVEAKNKKFSLLNDFLYI